MHEKDKTKDGGNAASNDDDLKNIRTIVPREVGES
jgi:hypothetical protein